YRTTELRRRSGIVIDVRVNEPPAALGRLARDGTRAWLVCHIRAYRASPTSASARRRAVLRHTQRARISARRHCLTRPERLGSRRQGLSAASIGAYLLDRYD